MVLLYGEGQTSPPLGAPSHGITLSPRIARLKIPRGVAFMKPAQARPLQDHELVVASLKRHVLEEGQQSVILQPVNEGNESEYDVERVPVIMHQELLLDAWCLHEVLRSRALSNTDVDRLYTMLIVYSTGFHQVVNDIRKECMFADELTMNIWKTFSSVLNDCWPKEANYTLRIQKALDDSELQQQYRVNEQGRMVKERQQLIQKNEKRVRQVVVRYRSALEQSRRAQQRLDNAQVRHDELEKRRNRCNEELHQIRTRIDAAKDTFTARVGEHQQWKSLADQLEDDYEQSLALKAQIETQIEKSKAHLDSLRDSIRRGNVEVNQKFVLLNTLIGQSETSRKALESFKKHSAELLVQINDISQLIPGLNAKTLKFVEAREKIEHVYVELAREGVILHDHESATTQQLVDLENEQEFYENHVEALKKCMSSVDEDFSEASKQKEPARIAAEQSVRSRNHWEMKHQQVLRRKEQVNRALKRIDERTEAISGEVASVEAENRHLEQENTRMRDEIKQITEQTLPVVEKQLREITLVKLDKIEELQNSRQKLKIQIKLQDRERENAEMSAEDQAARVHQAKERVSSVLSHKVQVQDLITAEIETIEKAQRQVEADQHRFTQLSDAEKAKDANLRTLGNQNRGNQKRLVNLKTRSEKYRVILEELDSRLHSIEENSAKERHEGEQTIRDLTETLSQTSKRKSELQQAIREEKERFVLWLEKHREREAQEKQKQTNITSELRNKIVALQQQFALRRLEASSKEFAYRRHSEEIRNLIRSTRDHRGHIDDMDKSVEYGFAKLTHLQHEIYQMNRRRQIRTEQLRLKRTSYNLDSYEKQSLSHENFIQRDNVSSLVEKINILNGRIAQHVAFLHHRKSRRTASVTAAVPISHAGTQTTL